tara:strand:- start:20 stop:1039 length:1020 start_codon:yes stop_codon:yes gene_type:complete
MNFKKLIEWSKREYSHLPWRKDRSLYTTLVSEIMLQQTTVATVMKKFKPFLERFPTVHDLAQASEDEVCIEWKGLGYYRRARSLRSAAIAIHKNCGGEFPSEREELKKLPGIGDYTSSALVAIGMDQPEIAVDANIERVLSRLFGLGEFKGLKLQQRVRELYFEESLINNEFSPRDFNEALMDLGRVFCQARSADCLNCPLSRDCIARISGDPTAFPRLDENISKEKEKHSITLVRVVDTDSIGRVAGIERRVDEWLAGQIDLPTFTLESSEENFGRYPIWKGELPKELMRLKSTITKYTFQNIVVSTATKDFDFYELDEKAVNFSSVSLKILRKLGMV